MLSLSGSWCQAGQTIGFSMRDCRVSCLVSLELRKSYFLRKAIDISMSEPNLANRVAAIRTAAGLLTRGHRQSPRLVVSPLFEFLDGSSGVLGQKSETLEISKWIATPKFFP